MERERVRGPPGVAFVGDGWCGGEKHQGCSGAPRGRVHSPLWPGPGVFDHEDAQSTLRGRRRDASPPARSCGFAGGSARPRRAYRGTARRARAATRRPSGCRCAPRAPPASGPSWPATASPPRPAHRTPGGARGSTSRGVGGRGRVRSVVVVRGVARRVAEERPDVLFGEPLEGPRVVADDRPRELALLGLEREDLLLDRARARRGGPPSPACPARCGARGRSPGPRPRGSTTGRSG